MEQRTRLNFSVWCQKSCIPRLEVWGQSRVTRLRLELLQTNKLILCSLCHLANTVKHNDSFLKNMLTTYKICISSSHSTSIALIFIRTPTLHIFINLFHFFAMPSSVVLQSLRFLFTLLSTHNTTRPRTQRRKMKRERKRRRKWEREIPPPMSGLEISRNLCQRNW